MHQYPLIIDGQYNIGSICTSQQCAAGRGSKVAMRWINSNLEKTDYTFDELNNESNKFANVLKNLGFQKGDIFFTQITKSGLKPLAILVGIFANKPPSTRIIESIRTGEFLKGRVPLALIA